MRSHLYGVIAVAAMIATPPIAETTTPTSKYYEHAGSERRDEPTDVIS
jgi:hypothetical protein